MDLRELRYFTAVIESGSFTAAAARLHLSQPTLSVAVSRLETELGVQLLVRRGRGVEPTSAGRHLLDSSARVLEDVDGITAALRRLGQGVSGSLTLAAVPVLLWHRVPELLRAHAHEVPDVEVHLVDPPPWQAIDLLLTGAVDVAAIVVAEPERFAERYSSHIDVIDWGPIPLVAALPPDSDDSASPLDLSSFSGETVFLPRRVAAVPSLPEAVDAAFRRHCVTPAVIRTVETIQLSTTFIEAGLGRAILPDPDRKSLSRFPLRIRELEPGLPPLRALVLTRPGGQEDVALRGLLQRVRFP